MKNVVLKVFVCLIAAPFPVEAGDGNNLISKGKIIRNPASKEVELTSYAYPLQLHFGDTLYVQTFQKNVSNNPIELRSGDGVADLGLFNDGFTFSVEGEKVEGRYACIPEMNLGRDHDRLAGFTTRLPGEVLKNAYPLELPPLHAQRHPFWEQVRQNMTEEGLILTLSVKTWSPKRENNKSAIIFLTHKIRLKARPQKEQDMLEEWFSKSPENFLPPEPPLQYDSRWWYDERHDKYKHNYFFDELKNHYVEIQGKKYSPRSFLRRGNFKPPPWSCIRYVSGWKTLEEALIPGTMRDEIRLTRMLIEYFEAPEKHRNERRKEIVAWLESRPGPQRMSMASGIGSLYGKYCFIDEDGVHFNELGPAYQKLLYDVSPMMSCYHQRLYENQSQYGKPSQPKTEASPMNEFRTRYAPRLCRRQVNQDAEFALQWGPGNNT